MSRFAKLALLSTFLGWMFDSMDLNLFTLVMVPSLRELVGAAGPGAVLKTGGLIVAVKIFGWGLGGVVFGVVADRIGRKTTMIWTMLIYAGFTALGGLAQSWQQLAVCQFLAGIGIGGEWAAGMALLAEVWPTKSRARALYLMQMAFPFGYFLAAGANVLLGPIGWRFVLAAGFLPAIGTVFIRAYLQESPRWLEARRLARLEAASAGRVDSSMATFAGIFTPGVRWHTAVGVTIALAMMVGSWAAQTLLPGWLTHLAEAAGAKNIPFEISRGFVALNLGTVAGFLVLVLIGDRLGRKLTYFIFCVGALAAIEFIFRDGRSLDEAVRLLPLFGFFSGAGYGTFSVYLPELFPTRMRGTGAGFCYNMSRLLTAPGPLIAGALAASLGSIPQAAATVALFLVVGIGAIWFGPETAGKALPE